MTLQVTDNFLVKGLTHKSLKSVKGVVIHWVANKNSSAKNNRSYWENLGSGVSAHYIIDLDGSILHCVPDNMIAYHVGCPRGYTTDAIQHLSSYPNDCTLGIECTHIDDKGTMTKETYATLVQLASKLLKDHNLTSNDLWLHSEIVGKDYKDCHRWFTTTNPSAWPEFKNDVNAILNPVVIQPTQPKKEEYKPVPKPSPKKKYVVLPANATSWAVYPLNKVPIKKNAKAYINPKKFKGLTYEILDSPQADVYTIQTDSFGKVNIYASKSTGAKIILK